jgi:hypothetical protein
MHRGRLHSQAMHANQPLNRADADGHQGIGAADMRGKNCDYNVDPACKQQQTDQQDEANQKWMEKIEREIKDFDSDVDKLVQQNFQRGKSGTDGVDELLKNARLPETERKLQVRGKEADKHDASTDMNGDGKPDLVILRVPSVATPNVDVMFQK